MLYLEQVFIVVDFSIINPSGHNVTKAVVAFRDPLTQ